MIRLPRKGPQLGRRGVLVEKGQAASPKAGDTTGTRNKRRRDKG
jgi:hypothetical protein